MMASEGTIPCGFVFFETELKGCYGAAKLVVLMKVLVILIGFWGTEKVWPRSARMPRMIGTDRRHISVQVGQPIKLNYRSLDADTKRMMKAIMAELPDEARVKRTSTPEELALTYPPGYSGDPEAEANRRPGTDT